MNKRNLSIIIAVFLLTATVGIITNATNVAAETTTSGSGQALEIAPPVINLSANPGQTVKAEINLRDVSSGKLLVTNQINDFIANGEDGKPKLLLDSNETSPYSIKEWINPVSELTLESKQLKKLPITIDVPADAAPGGYYGVIRFTGTPPELKGTGVSLSASLGALILLKVNGDVKEKISIAEFSVNSGGKAATVFESTPLNFIVRLKNSGNIHEQPSGKIAITDMFGKAVANVNVNLSKNNILPNSTRKFTEKFDSSVIGNKILFGKYTAKLSLTYGSNNQVLTQTIEFWVIPYTIIGVGIIVIIGGFIGLRYAIKRYNNYIISKSRGSRRRR